MCCLINSSHTQVDSQSLSFLQKEGCILPDILIHAKQFGSNIISRRRYDTEMKNKLAEEGWTTCLSWVIPIFLNLCKSLNTKFYLSLHSGSNVWQIQQWPCWQFAIQNWDWEVQRSKPRSKIAGKCTMPSFCTGLHYWTRTNVNCHPQKSIALWGSLLKGISGVPLITIQASCNSWKHSGKANSTKSYLTKKCDTT